MVEARSRALLALLPLLLGAAAHCSLLTSTDGLTGGASGGTGPRNDSGVPAGDPGNDAAPRDAEAPIDAEGDAGELDAKPPSTPAYCASLAPAPTFCDDFDHAPLATLWDTVLTGGGSIGVSSDAFVSSPSSLLATAVTVGSGDPAPVAVQKAFSVFSGKPFDGKLAFDVRIDLAGQGQSGVRIAALELHTTLKSYALVLRALPGSGPVNLSIDETASTPTTSTSTGKGLSKSLTVGLWAHVVIALTFASGTSKVSVTVDGETLSFAPSASWPTNPSALLATPQIELGATRLSVGDPWSVRFDNAVFDAASL